MVLRSQRSTGTPERTVGVRRLILWAPASPTATFWFLCVQGNCRRPRNHAAQRIGQNLGSREFSRQLYIGPDDGNVGQQNRTTSVVYKRIQGCERQSLMPPAAGMSLTSVRPFVATAYKSTTILARNLSPRLR